ncbi:MAG TPA: ABC-type transport auxiliary lipoprotein family protein [Dyella sp.]|uniref:ABC-type transport auxiliary lipoprotein family protein n=1 Tax=Dyella sp. TaxID=1869338 RepID=UPI002F9220F5
MRMIRRAISISLLLSLAACSVLPKAESPSIYRLPASAIPRNQAPTLGRSLRIDTPQAERMIDSARIVVLPEDNVISNYQGARWSDNGPTLLRNRLLDAFRDDGRIAALSSDDAGLQADDSLSGDLRAFQSEYRGGLPTVVIRYDARLVHTNGLRIVAARSFEVTEPVNGKAVPEVVAAFGRASDRLASQVVDWTLHQSTR